jgi:hypothetical protein
MALAVATAARLKPDIRLAKAVSEFEADLTSEQKADFRTQRSLVRRRPPQPRDVMLLTAKIDNALSQASQGQRTRCVGPRLTNVLSAIQQYVGMGDIIIGGSQNLIACGIWALVRTSLMMAVNRNTYLEKLSMLFMNAGRSAPRYQQLALLYQRSKPLQKYFCEYLIVVVQICHQTLRFSKKSYLGQLGSSLSDAEIKDYQRDLDMWASLIKDEVALLTSQRIEEEASQNSRFRAMSSMLSSTAAHHARLKDRLRILDMCSTFDYQTPWKQARKIGNTSLHSNSREYQEWRRGHNARTFICTGKLGSGKSVLLANIVDDLNLHAEADKIPVAYFFCRHDIPESLRPNVIIGSLLRQLLSTVEALSPLPASFSMGPVGVEPDLIPLLDYFFNNFKTSSRSYFVLDGLDECAQDDREILLDHCRDIQQQLGLALCVSYRLEADNRFQLSLRKFAGPNVFSIPETNHEIEAFIDAELQARVANEKLIVGDPALILEIRDALSRGAQGMFLWVTLQISALCTSSTDEEIKLALKNLPGTLSDTFTQILGKAKARAPKYQRPILESVAVARQPLTAEQLREVLAVVPGNTDWNPNRLLNDIQSTLACCGGLIIMDEEEDTIRLIHHSVKSFLTHQPSDEQAFTFDLHGANHRMGELILTYLNYNVFETQISMNVIPTISGGTAAKRVLYSINGSKSSTKMAALHLLQTRLGRSFTSKPDYDIGPVIANHSKNFRKASNERAFAFHPYTVTHWSYHAAFVSNEMHFFNDALYRLLETSWRQPAFIQHSLPLRIGTFADVVVRLSQQVWSGLDSTQFQRSRIPAPVSWALANSNVPLLRHCIRTRGLKAIASIVIELRRFDLKNTNPWPWRELMRAQLLPFAVLSCSRPFLLKLLRGGASVAQRYYQLVETAIDNDDLELLQKLLQDNLLQDQVNKGELKACIDSHEIDVVARACLKSQTRLIRDLIYLGVKLNRSAATDSLIWCLFKDQYSTDRVETAKKLSDAGVNINTPGRPNAAFDILMVLLAENDWASAWWLAQTLSNDELDQILLASFQNYSSLKRSGQSKLIEFLYHTIDGGAHIPLASSVANELASMIDSTAAEARSMVRLFVEHCDIERPSQNVLESLLLRKKHEMIMLLIDRGLDRRLLRGIISKHGLLQLSVLQGSQVDIEFLCRRCSADINASSLSETPLIAAIASGNREVDHYYMVVALISLGADVNYSGTSAGRSPLQRALDRVAPVTDRELNMDDPQNGRYLHQDRVTYLRVSFALVTHGAQLTDAMLEQTLKFSPAFFCHPKQRIELDKGEPRPSMELLTHLGISPEENTFTQSRLGESLLHHIEELFQLMVSKQALSTPLAIKLLWNIKQHVKENFARDTQIGSARGSFAQLYLRHIIVLLSAWAQSGDPGHSSNSLETPTKSLDPEDTSSTSKSLETIQDLIETISQRLDPGL